MVTKLSFESVCNSLPRANISFSNFSHSMDMGPYQAKLFLDIDASGKIREISFQVNDPSFEAIYALICDYLTALPIEKMLELSYFHLISIVSDDLKFTSYLDEIDLNKVLIHFYSSYHRYIGNTHIISKQLCRCFGVSYHDFESEISGDEFNLKEILLTKTKATLSCGSCKKDFEKYLSTHPRLRQRFYGKGRAQWILLLDRELKEFIKDSFQGEFPEYTLLSLNASQVNISLDHGDDSLIRNTIDSFITTFNHQYKANFSFELSDTSL